MSYFGQRRFAVSTFKDYKYDLAILIDPNEKTPPSNKVALAKFKKAADQIGFLYRVYYERRLSSYE
jgi:hypothetical protein